MIREKKNLARERKEKREIKRKKVQEKLNSIKSILIKNKESGFKGNNIQGWKLNERNEPVKI